MDPIMSKAWLLLVCSVLLPVTAPAHHSRVEFVGGAIHELEGEVVRVVWRNPHITITVRSRAADGTVKDWVLEGPGAGGVRRAGLVDGYFSEGDHVKAAGERSNRRENWLKLANVLTPGGTELIFSNARPRWSTDVVPDGQRREADNADFARPDGIFGVWVSVGGTPYDTSAIPPLNSAAMTEFRAYDPLRDDPALECDLPGMPRVMTIAGNRPFELEQRGEDIIVRSQNFNQTRIIHMGAHVDTGEVGASKLGHSRGRWEGETLVVTTTRINYPFFDVSPWWGIPQTEAIEIVERFTPTNDGLTYDFWAFDPTTFIEPIDKPGYLNLIRQPGLEVEADDCVPYYEDPNA